MKAILKETIPSFSWWSQSLDKKQELFGALVGAILVIPQGVTFSYLAGVPPEHGIYCAIFVTFLAAFFGNSIMMSGPNTATAILIGISVLPFAGTGSPLFVDYVMILSFMIGVIQLIFWLCRGAKVFQYITSPAISGLTMGVGFLIMLSSLNGILGLASLKTNFFYEKIWVILREWQSLVNLWSLSIGLVTIATGFLTRKKWPRNYHLIAILVGTLFGSLINGLWPQHITEVDFLGKLYIDFQFSFPKLHSDYLNSAFQLLPSAFSIAFLALAQSLVISRDLKIKMQSDLNLNKEVFAIGMANIIGSFFLAFAGSGSFNRTQVNEEMEVKSPLAALLTGIIVLLLILTTGSFLRFLPMLLLQEYSLSSVTE